MIAMVSINDFKFTEVVEDTLPYYAVGWVEACTGCCEYKQYIPPSGWMVVGSIAGEEGSHGVSPGEPATRVHVQPVGGFSDPTAPKVRGCCGCNTFMNGCDCDSSIGETWCPEQQKCINVANGEVCKPIRPVNVLLVAAEKSLVATDPTPTQYLTNSPEGSDCYPVAGKPWVCGGGKLNADMYDRYDCINGKITFVEHNSTRCGYQSPAETIGYETVAYENIKEGDTCDYTTTGAPYKCGEVGGAQEYDRFDCVGGKLTFIEHNSLMCGYQTTDPIIEKTNWLMRGVIGLLAAAALGGIAYTLRDGDGG
jgi:hypothetical protein